MGVQWEGQYNHQSLMTGPFIGSSQGANSDGDTGFMIKKFLCIKIFLKPETRYVGDAQVLNLSPVS
jgi:hypothetical protein